MAETSSVTEPYSDLGQQRQAAMMGMYIFLGSEIMLFGGIFAVAATIRILHSAEIVQASKALHYLLGALNTAILLTSSFFVALAVEEARGGRRHSTSAWLCGVIGLGVCFLLLKGYEYSLEYAEKLLPFPGAEVRFTGATQHLFMNLYFVATALHAIHLLVGLGLFLLLLGRVLRGGLVLPERSIVLVVAGLYWHLVDVIWVFLYPVFYLAR
ncbi:MULTISPECIES: cytochrome c oxidase subunit 3 [unclassified Sinorhizobium]|uniref:cytochrome c oxidase subunit 3 n=1 Tax=unclassified Sinorhizobium TaxID=2613772 RepID=UPI0035261A22